MKAFTWQFNTMINSKEVKNVWIYTDDKVYQASTTSGTMKVDNTVDHGFGKIPIVYLSQDDVEWAAVEPMIDRLEVSLSKLGASNDYSGHPILKLYGEVQGAPNKDEDGKAFVIPMDQDEDGKVQHGDVKFLTYDQAPEAIDLELKKLEKYIYSLTSTPDISFDNLKSLGNISGVALKLMFLDAIIKASMNEGDNRTVVQRIINIMIAGTVKTTNTGYKNKSLTTYFDIVFNSIIPDDLKTSIEMFSTAVGSGIMSRKTAVKELNVVDDIDGELVDMATENKPKEVG